MVVSLVASAAPQRQQHPFLSDRHHLQSSKSPLNLLLQVFLTSSMPGKPSLLLNSHTFRSCLMDNLPIQGQLCYITKHKHMSDFSSYSQVPRIRKSYCGCWKEGLAFCLVHIDYLCRCYSSCYLIIIKNQIPEAQRLK